jgi:rhamnosyltransferase subunit B
MARVVILTKGTAGDVFPFLAAGHALSQRGECVVFISHCSYRAAAEACGMEFAPLDDEEGERTFLGQTSLLNTARGALQFFDQYCLPQTAKEYLLLLTQCGKKDDTVILSRHMATIADLLVAENEGTPVVRVFMAVSQVLTLDLLSELIRTFLSDRINRIRLTLGMSEKRDWSDFLRLPSANIGNWPDWFANLDAEPPVPVTPVGFLTHEPSETGFVPLKLDSFLARDRKPVLITAGTGDFVDLKFYSSAIEACTTLGLRAIALTRASQAMPPESADFITLPPSLPMALVMPKMRAVIHHGGASTIARAIVSGVPQVVLAFGADRPDNAARLERLGVGRHIRPSQWTGAQIATTLSDLLSSTSVEAQCASLSRRIGAEHPTLRLCQTIDEVMTDRRTLRGDPDGARGLI